jgi:hypothetical protein
MPRTKQKAIVKWMRINRTGFLFTEVLDRGIPMDGAFTANNFAVNKWMVEMATQNKLLIDGVVESNIDLSKYVKSRFAKIIRIREMKWPEHLDPALARCEYKVEGSESTQVELMVQILKDNFKYMKNLTVHLGLDTDVSDKAIEDNLVSETIVDFLEILPQCVELETLNVIDKYCVSGHADQGSLQVKVMEIVQDLPKLTGLEWSGNMTESMWHAAKEGELAQRWSLFDYLPRTLTVLIISDGDHPRMPAWDYQNGVSFGLMALMRNKDKRSNVESLLLPKSFWGLDLHLFQCFMKHLNIGDIEEIGFSDEYKMNEGPIARVMNRRTLKSWRLPPPVRHLDLLVRSLTRRMFVDLGVCKDAQERAVRLEWVQSLVQGEDGFYKCEPDGSDEEIGVSFFTLHKKYTGSNPVWCGTEFRVDIRV